MRKFCPLPKIEPGLMFAQVQTSWLNFGDLISMIPTLPLQPLGKAAALRRRIERHRPPKLVRRSMVRQGVRSCYAWQSEVMPRKANLVLL